MIYLVLSYSFIQSLSSIGLTQLQCCIRWVCMSEYRIQMHIFSLTLFILKRMKDHSAFIYLHLWTLFTIYLVKGVYGIKIEGKYSFNSYILTKVSIYFLYFKKFSKHRYSKICYILTFSFS